MTHSTKSYLLELSKEAKTKISPYMPELVEFAQHQTLLKQLMDRQLTTFAFS